MTRGRWGGSGGSGGGGEVPARVVAPEATPPAEDGRPPTSADVDRPIGTGGSPNSRVPSSGSTIHTRAAESRALVVPALLGQNGVGRHRAAEPTHEELMRASVALALERGRVGSFVCEATARRSSSSAPASAGEPSGEPVVLIGRSHRPVSSGSARRRTPHGTT